MRRKPAEEERGRSKVNKHDENKSSRFKRIQDRNWFKSSSPEPDSSTDGSHRHVAGENSQEYSVQPYPRLFVEHGKSENCVGGIGRRQVLGRAGRRQQVHSEGRPGASTLPISIESKTNDHKISEIVNDARKSSPENQIKSSFSHRQGRVAMEIHKRESVRTGSAGLVKVPAEITSPIFGANKERISNVPVLNDFRKSTVEKLQNQSGSGGPGRLVPEWKQSSASKERSSKESLDTFEFTAMDVQIDDLISSFAERSAKTESGPCASKHYSQLQTVQTVQTVQQTKTRETFSLVLCKAFLCWRLKPRDMMAWWVYISERYKKKASILQMILAKNGIRSKQHKSRNGVCMPLIQLKEAWLKRSSLNRSKTLQHKILSKWKDTIEKQILLHSTILRFGKRRHTVTLLKATKQWVWQCRHQRSTRYSAHKLLARISLRQKRQSCGIWASVVHCLEHCEVSHELTAPSPVCKIVFRIMGVLGALFMRALARSKFRWWNHLVQKRQSLMQRGHRFVVRTISTLANSALTSWKRTTLRRRIMGHCAWQVLIRSRSCAMRRCFSRWTSLARKTTEILPYDEVPARELNQSPAAMLNTAYSSFLGAQIEARMVNDLCLDALLGLLRRVFFCWDQIRVKKHWVVNFNQWISKIELRYEVAPAFVRWWRTVKLGRRLTCLEDKVEKCVGSKTLFRFFQVFRSYSHRQRAGQESLRMIRRKLRRKKLHCFFSKWDCHEATLQARQAFYRSSETFRRWRLEILLFMFRAWKSSELYPINEILA